MSPFSSLPVDFVFEARGAAHSEFQFASNSKSVSPRMKQVEKSSNRYYYRTSRLILAYLQ